MNTSVLSIMRHPGFAAIEPYLYHKQYNDVGTPRVMVCVVFVPGWGEWFDGCDMENACMQALMHPTLVGSIPLLKPSMLEDVLLVLSRPFYKIRTGSRATSMHESEATYDIWLAQKERYTASSWVKAFHLAASSIREREALYVAE